MSDDEQGFCPQKNDNEFMEVMFIPMFPKRQRRHKSKSFVNRYKIESSGKFKDQSAFNKNQQSSLLYEKMIKRQKNKLFMKGSRGQVINNKKVIEIDSNFQSGNLSYADRQLQKLKQKISFSQHTEQLHSKSKKTQEKQKILQESMLYNPRARFNHIKTQESRFSTQKNTVQLPSIKFKNQEKTVDCEHYFKRKVAYANKMREASKFFNLKESTIGKQIIILKGFYHKEP